MTAWTRLRMTIFPGLILSVVAAHGAEPSISEYLGKQALNVVIIVSDMEASGTFYGEVMGLERMSPIPFGATTNPVFFPNAVTMQRFRVGSHEIKLLPGWEQTKMKEGGVMNALGFRMVNFPIADMKGFKKRLADHGYAEPKLVGMPGSGYRFGMLKDPDGNQVEFHTYESDAPDGWEESVQYAMTVSDVEATRKFYGELLGMDEMPAVPMPTNPSTKVYLFRNGPTIIKFWAGEKGLPHQGGRHWKQYGFRYVQYQTKDVHATHAFMKERGATIDLPPTPVRSLPVDIMFVADPDGNIHEMFGTVLPTSRGPKE